MCAVRAKNLTDGDIASVVQVLDGWAGKLSWQLLIEEIERRMYERYTRQALHKHNRIRDAFRLRKAALSDGRTGRERIAGSPELMAQMERSARLEAEVLRLRKENERLTEQFVKWAYNAHTRGLTAEFLDRPLPPVDRHRTKNRLKGSP